MPPNGTDLLFGILIVEVFLQLCTSNITAVMLASMVADIVEDAEVKTGRRSEGLLLSADNIFKKLVSGVGVLIAGAVLTAAQFTQSAKRGEVDPQVLWNLAVYYLPAYLGPCTIAILCLFAFNIDKAKHEANLQTLGDIVPDDADPPGAPAAAGIVLPPLRSPT
jgi:Na+/melibiose symporter-like transporter